MNINSTTSKTSNKNPLFLLLSIYTICAASYVITPLIPIYCIESLSNGGLAWSKAETFSIFGTFLALIYISPFIGGLLGDLILGKPVTALLGYGLMGSGLVMLNMNTSHNGVSLALLTLGLGIGFVKVNLTAAIGKLPLTIRQRGYEYYYVASCMGFVSGGLLSNPIFNAFQMPGVMTTALVFTGISICLFLIYFGKGIVSLSAEEPSSPPHPVSTSTHSGATISFFILILLGVPFFVCSNQLATGMPVFLHQCVNRTLGSWTIPTLWFGAIGSLTMTLLSPYHRKAWINAHFFSERIEPLKLSVGFTIIAASFATTAIFATVSSSTPALSGVPLLFCVHVTCFIADFHVRPVLFSAATALIPTRYHTLSTALVYACIGLGGKLAGTLASFVDTIGFPVIFFICSLVATVCGIISFVWWKKTSQMSYSSPAGEEAQTPPPASGSIAS